MSSGAGQLGDSTKLQVPVRTLNHLALAQLINSFYEFPQVIKHSVFPPDVSQCVFVGLSTVTLPCIS